jgi:hypothetical protein
LTEDRAHWPDEPLLQFRAGAGGTHTPSARMIFER